MSDLRCRLSELVDLHFKARITPSDESVLRGHLRECESCRSRYNRWLVLAQIDPNVPSRADRLAVGLGLEQPRFGARGPVFTLLVVAMLAGLAMIVGDGRWPTKAAGDRTVAASPSASAEFAVYRLGRDGSGALLHADAEIAPNETLGFAYANAAEAKHLMIFGVGEHRRVLWYHPDPLDPDADPGAPPIVHGELLHELNPGLSSGAPPQNEAMAPTPDEGPLRLFALFTNREDLRVSEVEAAVAASRVGRTFGLTGCELRSVLLHVRRSAQ